MRLCRADLVDAFGAVSVCFLDKGGSRLCRLVAELSEEEFSSLFGVLANERIRVATTGTDSNFPGSVVLKFVTGRDGLERVEGHGSRTLLLMDSDLVEEGVADAYLKEMQRPVLSVESLYAAAESLLRFRRAQFPAGAYSIVIFGGVGKTTTLSLIKQIFEEAGVAVSGDLEQQPTFFGAIFAQVEAFSASVSLVKLSNDLPEDEIARAVRLLNPKLLVLLDERTAAGELAIPAVVAATEEMHPSSIVVVNGDEPKIGGAYFRAPATRFGFGVRNHFRAKERKLILGEEGVETEFLLSGHGRIARTRIRTPSAGIVVDALAAAAVGVLSGVEIFDIDRAFRSWSPPPGRCSQERGKVARVVIDDTAGVSVSSLRRMLEALEEFPGTGRRAVELSSAVLAQPAAQAAFLRMAKRSKKLADVFLPPELKDIAEELPSDIHAHEGPAERKFSGMRHSLLVIARK